MALTIKVNFSQQTCKVIVTVADTANGGQPGNVTLLTDNSNTQLKQVARLLSTPTNIDFNAPKDGLIHQFSATLTVGNSQISLTQYLQVCSADIASEEAEEVPEEEEKTDNTDEPPAGQ